MVVLGVSSAILLIVVAILCVLLVPNGQRACRMQPSKRSKEMFHVPFATERCQYHIDFVK